jgi:primary-amine oxidase
MHPIIKIFSLNIRLDLDIDGINNTADMIDVEADSGDADYNPFHDAFYLKQIRLEKEKQARNHLCLETSRSWKFENNPVRNALGEPTGYKLHPDENSIPFASSKAWRRQRASFVNYHVWITPFNEKEMFAGRDYPNQSEKDHGLFNYTEQDRSIVDQDIILLVYIRCDTYSGSKKIFLLCLLLPLDFLLNQIDSFILI